MAAEIDCTVDLDARAEGRAHVPVPRAVRGGDRRGRDRRGAARRGAGRAHRPPHRRAPGSASSRGTHRRALADPSGRTPVTGLATQEMVTLVGIAAAGASRGRRLVGVEATGINACPCAQGLVRGRASERLLEAGFESVDVDRILELVPLATHNQRGRGHALRRHGTGARRRGARGHRRALDERAGLRAAQAARRAVRRRARAPAAALRRGLRAPCAARRRSRR